MEIQFDASCVKKTENKGKNEVTVTISDDKSLDFLNSIMGDPLVSSFMAAPKTKTWLAEQIGVAGLLDAYNKNEVLEKVGWEYVREFFLDHMNSKDILEHLGWEVTREHFADKIAVAGTQNDINTNGNKSILETLDASEGDNK